MPNIFQLYLTSLIDELLGYTPSHRIAERLKVAMDYYNHILKGKR